MILGVEPALGHSHIAGGLDEARKLGVGDLVPIDPEAVD
jgi:hypothetical protein